VIDQKRELTCTLCCVQSSVSAGLRGSTGRHAATDKRCAASCGEGPASIQRWCHAAPPIDCLLLCARASFAQCVQMQEHLSLALSRVCAHDERCTVLVAATHQPLTVTTVTCEARPRTDTLQSEVIGRHNSRVCDAQAHAFAANCKESATHTHVRCCVLRWRCGTTLPITGTGRAD
jgi:hypothetical protein